MSAIITLLYDMLSHKTILPRRLYSKLTLFNPSPKEILVLYHMSAYAIRYIISRMMRSDLLRNACH